MSYDLRIKVKVEGCNKYATYAEPELSSPTCNLRKMFVACMDWEYHQRELYKCSDVINYVERGIKELRTNMAKYEQYNPSNGWGDLYGAIKTLESLRTCIYECAEDIPIDCLYFEW